jgi:phosphoserine phosphatase
MRNDGNAKLLSCYDLDNTLIIGNSLLQFVLFIKKDNRTIKGRIELILFKIKLFVLVSILKGKKNNFLLRQLKGLSRDRIVKYASGYVSSCVEYQEIITERLRDEKKNNFIICIVSAGISEIVSEIANFLEVEMYFSSALKYDADDICCGTLGNDMTGKKRECIALLQESLRNVDLSRSIFTSDNYEDAECCLMIPNFRAVILNDDGYSFWENKASELIPARRIFK